MSHEKISSIISLLVGMSILVAMPVRAFGEMPPDAEVTVVDPKTGKETKGLLFRFLTFEIVVSRDQFEKAKAAGREVGKSIVADWRVHGGTFVAANMGAKKTLRPLAFKDGMKTEQQIDWYEAVAFDIIMDLELAEVK
jgi:hypothetical protein